MCTRSIKKLYSKFRLMYTFFKQYKKYADYYEYQNLVFAFKVILKHVKIESQLKKNKINNKNK